MRRLSLLWVVIFGAVLAADTINFPGGATIDGDGLSSVIVAEKLPVKLTAPSPGLLYGWKAPAGVTLSTDRGKVVDVTAAPPGKLEVTVFYAVLKGKAGEEVQADEKTWTFKLVVGGIAPQPPPQPPTPPDPISTSPFAEPGFRVLISFKTNVLRTGPERDVIFGPAKNIRDYLNAKCVPDPTGKERDGKGDVLREWRIWPTTQDDGQPTDVSSARKVWRDAWLNKGPEKQDWIMIGDGKTGYQGPLPKSEAEALSLLQKIGGP